MFQNSIITFQHIVMQVAWENIRLLHLFFSFQALEVLVCDGRFKPIRVQAFLLAVRQIQMRVHAPFRWSNSIVENTVLHDCVGLELKSKIGMSLTEQDCILDLDLLLSDVHNHMDHFGHIRWRNKMYFNLHLLEKICLKCWSNKNKHYYCVILDHHPEQQFIFQLLCSLQ